MPSEYWEMTAGEFLVLTEMEADNQPVTEGSKLKRRDIAEMVYDMNLTDEEWWDKHGAA